MKHLQPWLIWLSNQKVSSFKKKKDKSNLHTRNPCTGRLEGTFAAAQLAVSSLNASMCVLAYLPLTRPVFFSSALQQRGVIQNKEVTPEFRHRSWLWLHWYCLGYWMFFSKMHQLRLLLSWTQYFSVFKMEVPSLLAAHPIFILHTGWITRKMMFKNTLYWFCTSPRCLPVQLHACVQLSVFTKQ